MVLQMFDTVYFMVSRPAVTPVTTPPAVRLAWALSIVHVPAGIAVVFDSVMEASTHTLGRPAIAPAMAKGLTVTGYVAYTVPHTFVTV